MEPVVQLPDADADADSDSNGNLTDDELLCGTVAPIIGSGRPLVSKTTEDRRANADYHRSKLEEGRQGRLEDESNELMKRLCWEDLTSDEENIVLRRIDALEKKCGRPGL
jgi:hypothetical protein